MMCFTKALKSLLLTFLESGLVVPPITILDYISRQIFRTSQLCQNHVLGVRYVGSQSTVPAIKECLVNCTIVGPQKQCVCGCFVGAWEWEHLQEALEEKLKNSLAVAQLMERIRSIIGRERVKLPLFFLSKAYKCQKATQPF